MKSRLITAALLLVSLPVQADTYQFDFNDLSANSGVLQNKTGGAVAKDGGAFNGTTWPGGTSFLDIFMGGLAPTNPPAGYSLVQDAGTEPLYIGYGDAAFSGRGRFQYRDVVDFDIGTTWISWVFDFDQDAAADGTDALMSAGLTFGTNVQPTSIPTLGITIEPSGTPGSPLTYAEWAPAGLQFDDPAPTKRGTQGPDLGLDPNETHLVIAKLDAGADTITVWVNPPDVADEAAMGTPALSAALGLAQIPAIGFGSEGTGTDGPSGDPAEDFTADFDQARVSNQPNGFEIVTTTPDPILALSPADDTVNPPIYADLNFGALVSSTGTVRTVQFANLGPNNNITVEALNILDDAAGTFTITEVRDFNGDPVTLPIDPIELFPGDAIDVDVTFNPMGGTGTFTANLEVDTNEDTPSNPQDKLVPITATEFADGERILTNNPFFENGVSGWATDRVTSVPGIAPGSSGAALLDQAGDGFLIQGFPATPDFTASFYFAVPELTSPAAGESNLLVRIRGGSIFNGGMPTLAYFPAGVDLSPEPGLYTFDGLAETWIRVLGIDPIAASVDADANGSLDDPGDTKNVYKMTIVGRKYGSISYDYEITIAGIDGAAGGGTAAGLLEFDGADPSFELPSSIAFEQRDSQLPGAGGLTNQFGPWIDDVSIRAGTTAPDPDLNVAKAPAFGTVFDPSSDQPPFDTLVLRNDGPTDLSVTDITFADDTHFSFTPAPTFPITIPQGLSVALVVEFDAGGTPGSFVGDITITSNDSVTPEVIVPLSASAFYEGDKIFTENIDFEANPFDDQWINSGDVVAGPPLSGTGATGAFVAALATLERSLGAVTDDWELQYFFAVDDTPNRNFNIQFYNAGSGGTALVNLRHEAGAWAVFGGGMWNTLGQLNGVTGAAGGTNVYSMKIVGRGWGSPGASYDVFLSDLGGTEFTSAVTDLSLTQAGTLDSGPPTRILFSAQFGNNPGFWIDDVCMTAGAPAVDDPNFSLASAPSWPLQIDDNSPVTADLVVDNTGLNNTLNISEVEIGGANASNFSVLTALPVNIAPGAQGTISIQFERGDSPAGSFSAVATVTCNDETTPVIDIPLSANSLADSGKVLLNWDFEMVGGGNPFDDWNYTGSDVLAVPGLLDGSDTAAYISRVGVAMTQNFQGLSGVGNFLVEVPFCIKDTTARAFNCIVPADTGGGNGQVNIRYQAGNWFAFNGTPGQGGAWVNLIDMTGDPLLPSNDADGNGSLNDPGDTKVIYTMKVTHLGWGTAEPSFNLEILDAGGAVLASAEGNTAFQNAVPTTSGAGQIYFSSQFGSSPGFWIDDVCVTALEAVIVADLALGSVSLSGNDIILGWNDIGSSGYSVERSLDGENWTTIANDLNGITYTDVDILNTAPGLPGFDGLVLYRIFLP